jgi:uncharacterized SAM-binding protein YcdF (DUF218 family)
MIIGALSKILWMLFKPSSLVLWGVLSAAVLAWRGRARPARRVVCGVGAALLAITFLPLGNWLLYPLEARFPPPRPMPEKIDGIVVLGGSINARVSAYWGVPALSGQAERLTEAVVLARRYPAAKLVFSGGPGVFTPDGPTEAAVARQFFAAQGISSGRLIVEDKATNTYQNVVRLKKLLHPVTGERWLLVTSSYHLPRAVGLFRQVRWPVIPYPVDYKTAGPARVSITGIELAQSLDAFDFALYAWSGLVVYRLLGRTSALFPGPDK